ncbi:MAG: PD-(D/E)XK nuclease family protein [Candidatus Aenigmatarchaeota archaeon]
MIDSYIAREHRPKQIGRYYPSEVGNCMRKVWYSYKYPQEIEPDLRKIFEVGNIMHGFVMEVLRSTRNKEVEVLKSEMPFRIDKKDFVISGRVDDLILVRESGRTLLVEIKSSKDVSRIKQPQSNHIVQLMFYMFASGVHNGIILYIDKNNLQSKVFDIEYSERKARKIDDRFAMIHQSLKEEKLPVDEARRTKDMKWMCKFCEYKEKCDKNEK